MSKPDVRHVKCLVRRMPFFTGQSYETKSIEISALTPIRLFLVIDGDLLRTI